MKQTLIKPEQYRIEELANGQPYLHEKGHICIKINNADSIAIDRHSFEHDPSMMVSRINIVEITYTTF